MGPRASPLFRRYPGFFDELITIAEEEAAQENYRCKSNDDREDKEKRVRESHEISGFT